MLCLLPTWLVANCSSIPSCESMKGVAITPALLLSIIEMDQLSILYINRVTKV